ncbi:hypothetical protein ACWIG4_03985 [Streptomyces sp. NPDC002248]
MTGIPGAGKTVMAIYRAWALTVVRRDVVMLTRSNLLHQYLAHLAPDLTEAVNITTYHRWIRNFWSRRFDTDPPVNDEDGWSYDWVGMQKSSIERGVRSNAHLVIDEAQNLPVSFYQWCRVLGVSVTAFGDEDQPIDDEQSSLSEVRRSLGIVDEPLVLRENRRSSRRIMALAAEFRGMAQKPTPLPQRSGPTPMIRRVADTEALLDEVAQCFRSHPEQSIGIICRSIKLLRDIQSGLTLRHLSKYTEAYVHNDRYRDTVAFAPHSICVMTTASMKGLEFDRVFVPDLDAYAGDPTGLEGILRMAVLCTRAREEISFAYRGPKEPQLLADVPHSLLLRKAG